MIKFRFYQFVHLPVRNLSVAYVSVAAAVKSLRSYAGSVRQDDTFAHFATTELERIDFTQFERQNEVQHITQRQNISRQMAPVYLERTVDLVRYWERKQGNYPLLFCVAMDVLPAQATSVPCERMFSSSKLTCSDSRNRLSPETIEALQILKYTYKQSRLNFTPDLVAEEEDYGISGLVTQKAMDELTGLGAVDELNQLLANKGGDD